jgi:hypothetical protein
MMSDTIISTPALLDDMCGADRTTSAFALSAMFGNRLVWLHEQGIGYLNVNEAPYDAAYFEKYEGYAATEQGRAITDARVALVMRHMVVGDVADVGIGSGDFVQAMRDRSARHATYGYDINPAGIAWLNERDAHLDPYTNQVDALTFWDALEHIPDVARMIANARRYVFCSLPIVPGDGPPALDWRHLRRDEVCWYFTRRGFVAWMAAQGFECVEHGTPESLLGRLDIVTFAFRRIA